MTIFDYCFTRNKNKSKSIKGYRLTMYYLQLWEILMSVFEYKGLPDSVPGEWIEAILLSNGTVGIGEIGDTLYCCAGGYTGNYNGYIPKKYVGAVPAIGNMEGNAESAGEYTVEGEPGKTIVVGWNNSALAPDFELFDTATALTECRTSEDINVIFSRLLRIPKAFDSKEKTAIESAINALIDGKIEAVASKNKADPFNLSDTTTDDKFVDLVDVKDVDKLQFLNQYHDNVLKRFMRNHGISMQITNKLAQQTNAEMHGADDYSQIYPLQQLKHRKRMIDDLNRVFGNKYGFTASVEFSEIFKNSYDKTINYVPDELNEKGVVADEIDKSEDNDDSNRTD